jgi:nucleoside-diphosphate-sugar epimerase
MSGRIFIAGAAGAVGRPLCELLVADGWHVTGTTRSAERTGILRSLGVDPVVVDVYDAARLRDAVSAARPDVVVHQLTDLPPGLDPARMDAWAPLNRRIRTEGTRNLVAAAVAAGARRLVAQSIGFAYAPGPTPFTEEAPLNVSAPGRAGLSAASAAGLEQQVMSAPLEGVVLRYGLFYGPGTGFDVPQSGGRAVHVHAAANAARLAATREAPGVYNIAESDGIISSEKAIAAFGWSAAFRIGD